MRTTCGFELESEIRFTRIVILSDSYRVGMPRTYIHVDKYHAGSCNTSFDNEGGKMSNRDRDNYELRPYNVTKTPCIRIIIRSDRSICTSVVPCTGLDRRCSTERYHETFYTSHWRAEINFILMLFYERIIIL